MDGGAKGTAFMVVWVGLVCLVVLSLSNFPLAAVAAALRVFLALLPTAKKDPGPANGARMPQFALLVTRLYYRYAIGLACSVCALVCKAAGLR